MIVLRQDEGEPITAAFGLSEEESSREPIGLPPDGGKARAVRLSYLYTAEEAANDEFRLSGGLAVPLVGETEERIGTLAIFWRRVERTLSHFLELEQFEELSRVFGPALENADGSPPRRGGWPSSTTSPASTTRATSRNACAARSLGTPVLPPTRPARLRSGAGGRR